MDLMADAVAVMAAQLQKPTLAFLIGGMMLAALGSRLAIPEQVYKFVVAVLLIKVGLGAGMSIRETAFTDLVVPALAAIALGIAIVVLGGMTLARRPGVSRADGMATAGLFGAVSASTLAAGMSMLDAEGIAYEGYVAALYPFMDVAALVTAIVLARRAPARRVYGALVGGGTGTLVTGGGSGAGSGGDRGEVQRLRDVLLDTLQSPAISALLLGLFIGIYAAPQEIYESFYDQLFHGLLSILMLIMGMEAWARLSELRKVAVVYLIYGIAAPLVHGALGLAAGLLVHHAAGFSQGGVVLLAVLAASSSDISGPPTMRGALPEANSSAYVGTSTGLGTPVALLAIPLWIALADLLIAPS
ncbi:MAG: sodium-dependent bicarbonate transport family permease [Pseudomonadota bacterium]